jgi:hypothetical protein
MLCNELVRIVEDGVAAEYVMLPAVPILDFTRLKPDLAR